MKNLNNTLILSNKLIENCMVQAKREFVIARVGYHSKREFQLFAADGFNSPVKIMMLIYRILKNFIRKCQMVKSGYLWIYTVIVGI